MYMDMYEMVFPVWTTISSLRDQAKKIIEEAEEVNAAVTHAVVEEPDSYNGQVDNIVEECIDTIQAALNLIYKVDPECNIQEEIMRVFMKNKRRGYIPQN